MQVTNQKLAKTQLEGRYIFGGFKNGSAPFSSAGVYSGNNGQINVQTDAVSSVTLNLPGNQVFQAAGAARGVGILDAWKDLKTVLDGGTTATNLLALNLGVNLDATATTPGSAFPVGPDDVLANWEAGSNFSTSVNLTDSLGTPHEVKFLFRKTSATDWDYQLIAKRSELDARAPSSTDWRSAGNGTLKFDSDGALDVSGSTINAVGPLAWVDDAASQTIAATDLGFTGSTQLSESSAVLMLTQTNGAGFATEISRLDAALDHIAGLRAEVGARVNTAQTAKESVGVLQMQTQIRRGEIEGSDMYKIYSDFSSTVQTFQAALPSSARRTQTSLLDFLR